MDLLTRALGAVLMLAPAVALMWLGSRPRPVDPPARPVAASSDAEWLLLPFQLVAGLAGLLWCLAGLALFLSPLLVLAWLVVR